MPHMTTYGAQLDRNWTGSGAPMDQKWAGSGPEVPTILPSIQHSICLSVQKWTGSVRLSVCLTQTFPLPP